LEIPHYRGLPKKTCEKTQRAKNRGRNRKKKKWKKVEMSGLDAMCETAKTKKEEGEWAVAGESRDKSSKPAASSRKMDPRTL